MDIPTHKTGRTFQLAWFHGSFWGHPGSPSDRTSMGSNWWGWKIPSRDCGLTKTCLTEKTWPDVAWIFPAQTPKTQEAFGYASVTLTPSGLSMEETGKSTWHLAKGRHQKNQPETRRDFLICCKRKERSKLWVPLVFFRFMNIWTDSNWHKNKCATSEVESVERGFWTPTSEQFKRPWLFRVYRWLYYQLCGDYNKTSIRIPIKQPVFRRK